MAHRSDDISTFIEIARHLFRSTSLPSAGRDVAARVFERLRVPSDDQVRHRARYPACDWLDLALATVTAHSAEMGAVARAIKSLEPQLGWSRRTSGSHGSPRYIEDHVHGMICGPGGAESRYDIQLGFSLMAPHTRYPDHHHPPEEAYVLLTPGEFRQQGGEWFDPGIGGGIHNEPHHVHAMRSGKTPFLAIWSLLT
ncbi:transcriptional regulator [Burkholderia glumae]|uniref:dimethylsulfoniopropionate lyase n=1 Tax=Burkholderia glumae TaxID=337 RepID=UPI00031EB4B6|nr:dimethylsulfoniopropionate lyase [Burkholderia glumae]MCM2551544.1 dimethylsulfoniopropionate lyase [Burkholderia glumae]MCQ0031328.1 dimethylsulfoniopropionate lyase [Burkholderia glumae]MCQ0036239.1 dimethylsulfoniopropionate lyase [Burkholderia glumae]NVE25507.1 transcriptional regulator [Burkholderia glumae]PJO21393.1 transcriptional regulator [Burkholderia glumae AU6208]